MQYTIKEIKSGDNRTTYVPVFDIPSLEILEAFIFTEVGNFRNSVLEVIKAAKNSPEKVEFAGNAYLLSIENGNATIECTIDDAEYATPVTIELVEFEQVVKSWIKDMDSKKQMELINNFADFVNNEGISVGYQFKQLDAPEKYFNQPSLCGIFHVEQDIWLFVHQDIPARGDNPAGYFYNATYTTLRELIRSETEKISRKIRIAQKREQYVPKRNIRETGNSTDTRKDKRIL